MSKTHHVFRFGNERLTKGVVHLIDLCKDSPTYDGNTIGSTFDLFKQSKVDVTKLRRSLKEEVSKRLDAIGYWDFIPIPRTEDDESESEEEADLGSSEVPKAESSLAPFERKRSRKGKGIQGKLA